MADLRRRRHSGRTCRVAILPHCPALHCKRPLIDGGNGHTGQLGHFRRLAGQKRPENAGWTRDAEWNAWTGCTYRLVAFMREQLASEFWLPRGVVPRGAVRGRHKLTAGVVASIPHNPAPTAPYQNASLKPIWTIRGLPAEVIRPKEGLFTVEFGESRRVWLKILKNSPRTCSLIRSPGWKVLNSE